MSRWRRDDILLAAHRYLCWSTGWRSRRSQPCVWWLPVCCSLRSCWLILDEFSIFFFKKICTCREMNEDQTCVVCGCIIRGNYKVMYWWILQVMSCWLFFSRWFLQIIMLVIISTDLVVHLRHGPLGFLSLRETWWLSRTRCVSRSNEQLNRMDILLYRKSMQFALNKQSWDFRRTYRTYYGWEKNMLFKG